MSLSTCTVCGGHIPLGPNTTNCCETCGVFVFTPAKQTCAWWQDYDGIWFTACDEAHEFICDGPTENSYRFCPYCGKGLHLTPYVTPNESETPDDA